MIVRRRVPPAPQRARCGSAGLWGIIVVLWLCACAAPSAVAPGTMPGGESAQQDARGREEARRRFDALSQQLAEQDGAQPIDGNWLEQQLRDILATDPTLALARYDLGVVLEARGDETQASEHYELAAREAQPAAVAAVAAVAADENRARLLWRAGEGAAAAALLQRHIDADPKNTTSRLAMARLRLASGAYDEAIALSRAVLQRQADAIEAFRILAHAYLGRANRPMAKLTIARGLTVAADDVELRKLGVELLLGDDDLVGAVRELKQLIRLAPDDLSLRARLADIAMRYGDYGTAVQQLEAILKREPDSRAARLRLAIAYKGQGRFDPAVKLLETWLALHGDDPDALWNLAILYHRYLLMVDEAIATYRRFAVVVGGEPQPDASRDARRGEAATRVAQVEQLKNDRDAAAREARRQQQQRRAVDAVCAAVEQRTPHPDAAAIGNEQERVQVAWQLLADAQSLLQAGELGRGESLVHCAFAVVPQTPKAAVEACAPMQVAWTQLLYQLGRLDDAQAAIFAALRCDPDNPDAQLIEQQLRQIIDEQRQQQQQRQQRQQRQQQGSQGVNSPGRSPRVVPHAAREAAPRAMKRL